MIDDGSHRLADAVILTSPIPQSLALLVDAGVDLDGSPMRTEYDRTIGLLATLDGPRRSPARAACKTATTCSASSATTWPRASAPKPAITFHANPTWSEAHWDDDDLLDAARRRRHHRGSATRRSSSAGEEVATRHATLDLARPVLDARPTARSSSPVMRSPARRSRAPTTPASPPPTPLLCAERISCPGGPRRRDPAPVPCVDDGVTIEPSSEPS